MQKLRLCLAAIVMVARFSWGAAPGWIGVDNQTYDTVYLSRIGNPSTSVLVPKRMLGQFQVFSHSGGVGTGVQVRPPSVLLAIGPAWPPWPMLQTAKIVLPSAMSTVVGCPW